MEFSKATTIANLNNSYDQVLLSYASTSMRGIVCKTFNRLKKLRLSSIAFFMFATFLDFFQWPSSQILIQ